ncbi:MAG: AAA family ATPase [Candidatus Thorarchaeota archaeon]|nr:AAA family ATPase [Candidatus Thorarchaeota archaeon]
MSIKEILSKGRDLYQTHIAPIDEVVPEGFPRNAFGVIRGPGGGGKSVILSEMVRRMTEAGKKVIYVCFEDTPVSVLQNLVSLGWDYEKMLDKNLIDLIDCFSAQILKSTRVVEHSHLVKNPDNPEEVTDAIQSAIQENGDAEIGGIFLDSITEIFLQSHPFKAVNSVKAWRATFCKEMNIPFWAVYHLGLQQFAAYDDLITYTSDAIIDTRHEPAFEKAGFLLKQFRVTKIKGAPHNTMWVTFDVGNAGIRRLSIDELRDLAKDITRVAT